jgi:hypothetical protein
MRFRNQVLHEERRPCAGRGLRRRVRAQATLQDFVLGAGGHYQVRPATAAFALDTINFISPYSK